MHRVISRTQMRSKFGRGRSQQQEPIVPCDLEDPRQRGILRKSSCHMYRQRLQSKQQANLFQSMMILMGMAMVVVMIWCQAIEQSSSFASDHELATEQSQGASMAGTLNALWLGVSDILGLNTSPTSAPNALPTPTPANGGGGRKGTRSSRSNHCNKELDTKRIFRQIGKHVLNQEKALARLERAVKNDRLVRSVALVGPPGVGKTLTAMVLRQQFPWPENMHSYSWSTNVPDGAHKFNVIRNFVEQLSSCGQNLLIIDNLSPCDYSFVSIYNKLVMEHESDEGLAIKHSVLIIYIFSLEPQYYWQQFELLQQLPMGTTIINYRPFGRAELVSCLEYQLSQEDQTLDMCDVSYIIDEAMLDVEEVGCKRIRKLLISQGLSDPK